MGIAPDAVGLEKPARRRRLSWTGNNRLVRGVSRVPAPLGVKLIVCFALIAALLAVGYALGLVALGQSNSRGSELRRVEERAVYEQLLRTDATQLTTAIDSRINSPASTRRFGSGLDQTIANEMEQLCLDATGRACLGPALPAAAPPLSLAAVAPPLLATLTSHLALFGAIAGSGGSPAPGEVLSTLNRADEFAGSFAAKLTRLASKTRARADAVVAADHQSFASSRELLVGVGAGSIALALAFGLLLSWSLVVPLRRTQERLAQIAAGDFAGHVDVPNRDEIGALAADVNRMNDELGRVYRELELASANKSDFLANMSHELRTPLNAVIGFSEVLHEQMFGELNERQLAYVEDIMAAGKHQLSLINDILDLAKIEAGRMELELSQVAIPDVLRSAVSMHSERASRGGVELALRTEPEQILVIADERRVRQVVFNLLSNAVKFTPAQGQVEVSALLADGHVEVAVADTGHGIPPEDLETIFQEFEQTSEGKQVEGTGLGLPLSRKLVELHGGRLWVESEVGRGSTFRFTLPVRQDA